MTPPDITAVAGLLRTAVKDRPFLHRMLRPVVDLARRASAAAYKRRIDRFRDACMAIAANVARPVFVKVGANDGVTGDPCSDLLLGNAKWRGVLIEPVPSCFARLQANFSDRARFTLEQVAIGATAGTAKFYFVDAEAAARAIAHLPYFYDQLGSFDRGHIVRHFALLEPYILERDVEVCTLSEVLERNALDEVHLLHVDVEGHDFEVLKSIDLARRAPVMIFIEHKHLSKGARSDMRGMLRSAGYTLHDCGTDYFALHEAKYRLLQGTAA